MKLDLSTKQPALVQVLNHFRRWLDTKNLTSNDVGEGKDRLTLEYKSGDRTLCSLQFAGPDNNTWLTFRFYSDALRERGIYESVQSVFVSFRRYYADECDSIIGSLGPLI